MATQLPSINVIRDSSASPDHAFITIHNAIPTVPPTSLGPEVALSASDAQGLEVDTNGPYPQPTTDSHSAHRAEATEKQLRFDDAGLIPSKAMDENVHQKGRERRICGFKRRTFIIIASTVVIVMVCAAIGGGVGGYYAHKTSTSPPSPSATAPVTSGTTGMAALPCTETRPITPLEQNPFLTTGATFNITCRKGLPPPGDRNGNPISNLSRWTTYNITDCMEKCAVDTACKGIVYGANLTAMVQDGDPGGNCLLKNATWVPTSPKEYWFASAVKV